MSMGAQASFEAQAFCDLYCLDPQLAACFMITMMITLSRYTRKQKEGGPLWVLTGNNKHIAKYINLLMHVQ